MIRMKKTHYTIALACSLLATGCTKLEQPVSYAPVITFNNYANNPNLIRPRIQNDTVVIGYPKQEFTVNFAAPNALAQVSITGPDTSFVLSKPFENETKFNEMIMVSRPCPDKTIKANWVFKATDRAGKSTERSLNIVYVDTFKIIPLVYNRGLGAFDLVEGKYINPNTQPDKADVEDKNIARSNLFYDNISHVLHARPETGTLFVKATDVNFFDVTINRAYLDARFINPADSVVNFGRTDVIICKLRGGSDYALLYVNKIEGSNTFATYYAENYYVFGYRKVTE